MKIGGAVPVFLFRGLLIAAVHPTCRRLSTGSVRVSLQEGAALHGVVRVCPADAAAVAARGDKHKPGEAQISISATKPVASKRFWCYLLSIWGPPAADREVPAESVHIFAPPTVFGLVSRS